MSSALTAAAALVATVPAALLALGAGYAVERLTRSPCLREAVWTAAFLCPLLAAALAFFAPDLSDLLPRSDAAGAAGPVAVTILAGDMAAPAAAPDITPFAAALVLSAVFGAGYRLSRTAAGARRLQSAARRARPLDPARGDMPAGTPPVLVSDEVDRPLLAGFFRPAVLLPRAWAEAATPCELALVCAHEAAHARRGDNLRLTLESGLEGLLWFNPFLAACRRRLSAAREEVCDLAALEDAPAPVRHAYARTLVHALRLSAGPEPLTSFIGARSPSAMRVRGILNPAPSATLPARAAAVGLLGSALLASAAAAAALDAALPAPPPEAPPAALAPAPAAASRSSPAAALTPRAPAAAPGLVALAPLAPLSTSAPAEPARITRPEWVSRPGGADVADVFPAQALREGKGGRATIECTVTAEGMLRGCRVVNEAPEAAGFGDAALKLAPRFAMRPNLPEGAPVAGGLVRVPILFSSGSDAPTPPAAASPAPPAPQGDGGIEIIAKTVTTNRGRDGSTASYLGDPQVRGLVGPVGGWTTVLLDGRALPPGFDLQLLDQRRIERVDVTSEPVRAATPKGPGRSTVNIVTR